MTHTGVRWVDKVRKNEGVREREGKRREVRLCCTKEEITGRKLRKISRLYMYTHLIINTKVQDASEKGRRLL